MPDRRRFSIQPIGVIRDATLSDCAKVVAQGIGAFMSPDGLSWPGVRAIAKELGRSERTIKRGIAELVRAGYLTRKRRRRQAAILTWSDHKTGQRLAPLTTVKKGQIGSVREAKSGIAHTKDRAPTTTRLRTSQRAPARERTHAPPTTAPQGGEPQALGDLLRQWRAHGFPT